MNKARAVLTHMVSSLQRNEQGSVLVLAGLWFLVLVAVGGAGFDLARQQIIRLKLQQATDAAALAGALLPAGASTDARKSMATRYYELNFPTNYLGTARPPVTVNVGATIEVTANTAVNTSFMSAVSVNTLKTTGRSVVALGNRLVDYDLVMVVDESGSTRATCPNCGGKTRMEVEKESIIQMLDTVFPDNTLNPDVRFGLIGYTQHISNKWSLTSVKADAVSAVEHLKPRNANFDHYGLEAGLNMITGNVTTSTSNMEIPDFTAVKIYDCNVDAYVASLPNGHACLPTNITPPCVVPPPNNLTSCFKLPPSVIAMRNTEVAPPQTLRNSGANVSPVKNLVFITDGFIMLEPDGCLRGRTWFGEPPVPGASCPNYAKFLDKCQKIKDAGATLFIVSFVSQSTGDINTLKECASLDPKTGKARYFFAPDGPALRRILEDVGISINKVRISE